MSKWRLAVLAGLLALVTACGSGGGEGDGVASLSDPNTPGSSGAPKDDEPDVDQMRAYAKCMREHGVDVKDPDASGGGGGGGIAVPAEGPEGKEKVDKANEACKQLLPNGGEPRKPTAEELDQMREMAKCLRDHGIDVKEPTADDPGIGVSSGDGTDNDPDKVNKAMEECSPDGARIGTYEESAK